MKVSEASIAFSRFQEFNRYSITKENIEELIDRLIVLIVRFPPAETQLLSDRFNELI